MVFPPPPAALSRRVVVTGIGMVTPLGVGTETTWNALLSGRCGVRRIRAGDPHHPIMHLEQLPTTLAATVPHGTGLNQFNQADWPKHPRFIQYALAAAEEALHSAEWIAADARAAERAGVAVASGIGSLEDVWEAHDTMAQRGYRRLSPHFVPRILINLAAGHISIRHGLRGPLHGAVTACATGAHAVGDAFRFIKNGDADVMLAGGTEASINHLSLGGFARMTALSTRFNDEPERASRPFDAARDGFVLGEGAAVLVLEELSHAAARGAEVLAEIRGYGLSADARHVTAPPLDGDGAARAMWSALRESGLLPAEVDYLNAHATSTPLGDAAEAAAIHTVFGRRGCGSGGGGSSGGGSGNVGNDRADGVDLGAPGHRRHPLLVSSTKGATGHLLGAAGALEAAIAVLAIRDGAVPVTLNLNDPDPPQPLENGAGGGGFVHVRGVAARADVAAAMSNSFGFGGTNVSLVFARV